MLSRISTQSISPRSWLLSCKMRLDLLERLALGLRQEEGSHDEVHDGEAREEEEHGRVAVLADERQKDAGESGGDQLVDDQRDAHAVGADARGHQLREGQPD